MEWWILYVDGSLCGVGAGIGFVLQFPIGEHLEQAIWLGFYASNNEAMYEVLLVGISLALSV